MRFFATISVPVFLVLTALPGVCQTDWPVYGHDAGGQRYSPLTQIDTKNVSKLKLAWQYGIGAVDLNPAKTCTPRAPTDYFEWAGPHCGETHRYLGAGC